MKLANEFTVGVPIEQAWAVLTDLELIAPCMPGAQLTGVNDGVYTGKVKIKVGPVTAEYAGTAQFTEKDAVGYRAVIDARGRDSRGQGNATALISAALRPEGTSTVVTVDTDLAIAGRIAQFGSGMIKEVSAKLLGQFVQCLEDKLNAGAPAGDATSAGVTSSGTAPVGTAPVGTAPVGTAPVGTAPGDRASGDAAQTAGDANGRVASAQPAAATAAAPATAAPVAAAPVTGSPAGTSPAAAGPAPLDLMSVAGRAVYKRLLPLVAVAVIVVVVVIVLIVR